MICKYLSELCFQYLPNSPYRTPKLCSYRWLYIRYFFPILFFRPIIVESSHLICQVQPGRSESWFVLPSYYLSTFFFFLLFLVTGIYRFVLSFFIFIYLLQYSTAILLVSFVYYCYLIIVVQLPYYMYFIRIQVVNITTLRNWYNFVSLFSLVLGQASNKIQN